jgi:hypothetical protein
MVDSGEVIDNKRNAVDPIRVRLELNNLAKVLSVVSQAIPIILTRNAYSQTSKVILDEKTKEISELSNKLAIYSLQYKARIKGEFSAPVLCVLGSRIEYLCDYDSNLLALPKEVIDLVLNSYISHVCFVENQKKALGIINEIKDML